MFVKRFILLVSVASILSLSSNAFATMSDACGWYLEGNIGGTKVSGKNYPGSATTNGLGGGLNLGYKFMPFFALEAGYTYYANTTIDGNNNTKAATDKHYSYNLTTKGIIPITDTGFEGFAKLGVGRVNSRVSIDNTTAAQTIGITSSNNSATGLFIGVGGQYYFNPQLAVVVQWAEAQGNSSTGNLQLLSVGASYIFG